MKKWSVELLVAALGVLSRRNRKMTRLARACDMSSERILRMLVARTFGRSE